MVVKVVMVTMIVMANNIFLTKIHRFEWRIPQKVAAEAKLRNYRQNPA